MTGGVRLTSRQCLPKGKETEMKFKKTALLVLAAVLLVYAFVVPAGALPEDDSSTAYTETVPASSQEPETQPQPEPTDPPYSEPEPQPEPSSSQEPVYTDPPPASSQTDAPVSSEEETEHKSWLDIFKLPTEPTNGEETVPEKKDTQTTTTQYVVMGILLWVLIACGTLVTLGVLASTHRRKRGK